MELKTLIDELIYEIQRVGINFIKECSIEQDVRLVEKDSEEIRVILGIVEPISMISDFTILYNKDKDNVITIINPTIILGKIIANMLEGIELKIKKTEINVEKDSVIGKILDVNGYNLVVSVLTKEENQQNELGIVVYSFEENTKISNFALCVLRKIYDYLSKKLKDDKEFKEKIDKVAKELRKIEIEQFSIREAIFDRIQKGNVNKDNIIWN